MAIREFQQRMNVWGEAGVPFLFFVDFEMAKPWIERLQDIRADQVLYDINGQTNAANGSLQPALTFKKFPPDLDDYKKKFRQVYNYLQYGDSFLTNLTVRSEVVLSVPLSDAFYLSNARYKLLFNDDFLVFSPEIFVQIRDGMIFSYPMKGTIDASKPNAGKAILSDQKELSEHVTIVDLIRNDLSRVASNVCVTRFRYLDTIRTYDKTLLQVSSEIVGCILPGLTRRLGDALVELLPAGSVSGAPKPKTLKIIAAVEGEPRGYYTGVMGLFDGKNLDCGVMIRYIEKQNERYYYRSGGGITTQSDVSLEYQEAVDKVYVPFA
jgi:para-aminobenzoate synthetase component 1